MIGQMKHGFLHISNKANMSLSMWHNTIQLSRKTRQYRQFPINYKIWKFAGITTQEKLCPTWKKQQWPWTYITRMKICTVQKVNAITDLEIMKKLKRMPRRHSMSIRIVLKGLSAKQKPCIIWVHLNIPSNFGGGKKEILITKFVGPLKYVILN